MCKAILMIRNLAIGMALWATAGAVVAADVNLVPSVVGFNSPIGIDFQETSGKLVLSAFYPGGLPNNLELADPTTGVKTPFSALAGLTNELKIATVRASACLAGSGFVQDEVFTGNGNPGQIVRIGPLGVPVQNPWVTLPGEAAIVRGSLFQDRFGVAGCNLIAVTGNEQSGAPANDNIGNVWRITSAGVASLVATVGTHLEGVTTLPNDPLMFGPAAGRILAGAEQYTTCASPPAPGCGPPNYSATGGLIVAVNPNSLNDFFTIGGPGTTGFAGHVHYLTNNSFHPEDIDIIRANAQFFGIAFRDGIVYSAPASDFANRCGQILITQEFPFAGTSGLSALRWNATTSSFITDALTSNVTVQQWEHVTFTSGNDCATTINIVKTPDNATFNIGDQLTWTIVVSNTGAVTAGNVKLDDPLPTTGGLTWSVFSVSAGTCNAIPSSQVLHCDLGNILPSASVTVVVKSSNVGGAPAASCTGQKINNIGTASASNAPTVTDHGDYTCTPPPHLKVVKTPDGGTFTQGGAVSFKIVVTNDGLGTATGVKLSDQLPTAGGLNWSAATVTTGQGTCSISASSLLTCNIGTMNAGASVTVTVSLATTPAGACQSQVNPAATATDDQHDSAQDSGSLTCTPPATLQGRMTGGGSIFTGPGNQTRVTHGFELHCDANDKRQSLEINWPGTAGSNNFHLTAITKATCIDDPSIQPQPPDAGFDTYIGEGVGTCNGQPATIRFIFTDAGEPGTSDTAEYHISGACTLNTVKTLLTNGNHQAHKN